ncbi:MAG: V-type ATP synthase subunit E [Patescibacteria group bacterium]
MALDDILKKIEKETKEKIKKIKEEANLEIKKIEEKYQKEIEKKKNQILDQVKEETEKKIKHHQIKVLLETKNLILSKKQEILEKVYQEVLDRLSKLSDEEYLKLILILINKCPEDGQIIPAKNREKITQKAILESKKKITLSKESLPIKGGFIFSSKKLEIDNSFENLIKIIREKTEIEVAKILFKDL